MGVKIPDLGNQHPYQDDVQKKETKGDLGLRTLGTNDDDIVIKGR